MTLLTKKTQIFLKVLSKKLPIYIYVSIQYFFIPTCYLQDYVLSSEDIMLNKIVTTSSAQLSLRLPAGPSPVNLFQDINPLKFIELVKWTYHPGWKGGRKKYKLRSVVSRIVQSRWEDEMHTEEEKSKQIGEKGVMNLPWERALCMTKKNIFASAWSGRDIIWGCWGQQAKRLRGVESHSAWLRGKDLLIRS